MRHKIVLYSMLLTIIIFNFIAFETDAISGLPGYTDCLYFEMPCSFPETGTIYECWTSGGWGTWGSPNVCVGCTWSVEDCQQP